MDRVLQPYLSQAVPRYTSYPTAPHFHGGVGPSLYRQWLGGLDPAAPVSLYLHVPFCRKVCWYCGCNMKLAARYAPIAAYVETLLQEIALLRAALPGRLPVGHLHWGGGTPTALAPEDLARVMAALRDAFDIAPDAELAIECDPRTLTAGMADRLGELGFTRASFGVQEFDPTVQLAINRIQPPSMVAEAVSMLRGAGVAAINFDLIYGLPHQTAETLTATIGHCLRMAPDRVALFGYAHVPWMAKKQQMIPEDALPDADARFDQASRAAEALTAAGYHAIGLDHFARPTDALAMALHDGSLRRNFQGYTTDTAATLLGLGATAIGQTPDGYVQNLAETGAWSRAVASGDLPVAKGLALTDEDRLRGRVIERIMCFGTVDTAALCRAVGRAEDWLVEDVAALSGMAADGLVAIDGPVVTVTERGAPLLRVVAAAFDAYLRRQTARHTVAV